MEVEGGGGELSLGINRNMVNINHSIVQHEQARLNANQA